MAKHGFGNLPIDGHQPESIVDKFAQKIEASSEAECDAMYDAVLADLAAKKQMHGARAALESLVGLIGKIG